MTIELQFLGAARHVTGTKHLLTIGSGRVLLDCGMVQGPRRVADEQNRKLPIGGQVFVVHGEDEPAEAYAGRLRNAGFASVFVPSKYDRIEVD